MESIQTILPSEIHQTIASNQITELMLKDGTILKIKPNLGPLNKKKIIRRNKSSTSAQTKIQNFQENLKGNHKHYNDGNGLFGQHFKTEYSQICPDCTEVGGIIKRRQNYVLYVSKNVTEENISKTHKNKNNYQTHQQVPIQGRIPISYNYTKQTYNQQGGRVISQGFVECDYVPEIKPKTILRNEKNQYKDNVCPECSEVEKVRNFNQQNQLGEKLCPDCSEGEQEEKITTTVKVLVPDENA